MIIVRLILLIAVLFSSPPAPNGELEKGRDCKFITCRDCATMGCVWIIYFTKAQACVASSKSVPGVESQVDDPSECAHPTCIMPSHEPWDATGLAQFFGGIFGGLVAGICGAAGIQSWRRGRNRGYEELGGGRRSWMELARAFFTAFFDCIRRVDEEAFLHGDDEEDEVLRQEAIRRNARRNAEARRNAQAPRQVEAQVEIPRADQNAQEIPEVVQNVPQVLEENRAALRDGDDDDSSDGSGDGGAHDAEDERAGGANVVGHGRATGDNVAGDGHTTDEYSTGDDGADGGDGVEDRGGDGAEVDAEGDGDDDDDATDNNDGEQAGVSPLVQECATVRRSIRQAAAKARENIQKLKLGGNI